MLWHDEADLLANLGPTDAAYPPFDPTCHHQPYYEPSQDLVGEELFLCMDTMATETHHCCLVPDLYHPFPPSSSTSSSTSSSYSPSSPPSVESFITTPSSDVDLQNMPQQLTPYLDIDIAAVMDNLGVGTQLGFGVSDKDELLSFMGLQTSDFTSATSSPLEYLQSSRPESDCANTTQCFPDEHLVSQDEAHCRSQSSQAPVCWNHGCNGKIFSSWSNLRRHQRERDGVSPKSFCPRCGAYFSRTTARNQHLANMSCTRIRRYSNGRERPSLTKLQQSKRESQASSS